jgi:amino acid transporter
MTVTAALSYGELSGMFPKAGGQYVYLKEAYNPLIGFLYGWSFFSIIQTATIAAVAVAFAKFTAYLFPQFSEDITQHRLKPAPGNSDCYLYLYCYKHCLPGGVTHARYCFC